MFGPGVGECVVVHLGAGQWMVVDSCLNDSGKEPVALEYLRTLDVDVARQVVLLVLTHFHDDHIRGAARLFREAESARFVCSAALDCREFFQLIEVSNHVRPVTVPSSLVEVGEIFEELHERAGRPRRSPAAPDVYAQHDMTLFGRTSSTGVVTVRSLCPSSLEFHEAWLRFCELIPEVGDQIRRVPAFRSNDATV
ncbi:MAG: MBL fold metallo-hydrolase, partial [Maioricimonas sp. JB049]